MLLSMFVIVGIYAVMTNADGSYCGDPVTQSYDDLDSNTKLNICVLNWVTKYSLYNKNGDFKTQLNQEYFNMVFLLCYFVAM